MKSKTLKLDLKPGSKQHRHMHVPSGDCCRNHMVVVPGTGDENFKFPPVQELVIRALNRLSKPVEVEETDDDANPTQGSDGTDNGASSVKKLTVVTTDGTRRRSLPQTRKITVKYEHIHHTFVPGLPTDGIVPAPLLPRPNDSGKANGATLFTAAQALREIMDEGRFDAIIADRFDPLAGAVNWARLHMEERFQGAIESLNGQLRQLRVLYKDALPRVLTVLAAQNPDVPEQMLLQVAVQVLDEELAQILTVLRIWTDAFAQHRDQMYEQLGAVRQLVEESYALFRGEALDGESHGKKADVHTTVFQVGNVFVARFGHLGPATLPAKGPIGAHAIEVPMDERNIITLMLPLYAHEFRHDVFHDVVGLEDDVREAVAKAIVEAYEKGELKFSQEYIKLGRQKVKTIDLLVKFIADTTPEIDADISGGVLLTGVAFLYLVILSFSAFNARGRTVESTPRLLRTGSYFELVPDEKTGAVALEFFPHPPDYIRAHIVAAALDEIGFKSEANECRTLADIACGDPLPETVKWFDATGKSKLVIEIPVADIKAVAPVVAKALIRTPLKSLGNVATGDILNWDKKRQAKVDKLAELLMQGRSDIPESLGDVYATYVAAAAALAYWGAVGAGQRAKLQAVPMIEKNALAMLATIRERRKQAPTVADAGDEHASCVHGADDSDAGEVNPHFKPDAAQPETTPADEEGEQPQG
ncbi:MAG: FAD-binding oxidoreductase [Candidatus Melainabacteria bacterium]|nr:FAD-binding oxidoreductase [Candidatus Melainabacteria bacterium]